MLQPKNDTVFQLSLTELAFVLTFVVLLLIGSKFVLMDRGCREDIKACDTARKSCELERDACYLKIPTIVGDPKQAIDSLVNEPRLRVENENLKKQLSAKEAQLTAVQHLQKNVTDAPLLAKALQFLNGYEQGVGKEVAMEAASDEGKKLAAARKELDNCRGQLSHCVIRAGGTKGYGHPPCWTDSDGGIEYIFEVEIRSDGLSVSRAWPPSREADAKALQGAHKALESRVQSLVQFKETTRSIFDESRKSNPECRHYVVLRKETALRDIDAFNTLRLGVEDFFYKLDRTGVVTR